jgi:NAD(P)-dependent dehydrogenase (short-subunit alcohol dehydrogenase family)
MKGSSKARQAAGASAEWLRGRLEGKVAVVAGASRGAGRGIALALGDAGATVYVAGRTTRGGWTPSDGAPGTIDDTAEEVTRRGGHGIAVRADCTVKSDIAALFARVEKEHGRLDVLANAVWGANEHFSETGRKGKTFWELDDTGWHTAMMAGAYAHLQCIVHAARIMVRQSAGLIACVTEPIIEGHDYSASLFWMFWGLGHQSINRIIESTSRDLKKQKIAILGLAPGWMRTERVLMHTSERERKSARYAKTESTEYVGRAVVALAAQGRALRHSGKVVLVGDLAREYGFADLDGRQPNFYREMKML